MGPFSWIFASGLCWLGQQLPNASRRNAWAQGGEMDVLYGEEYGLVKKRTLLTQQLL
jgi:hypothetical protein